LAARGAIRGARRPCSSDTTLPDKFRDMLGIAPGANHAHRALAETATEIIETAAELDELNRLDDPTELLSDAASRGEQAA
jgi:hypothetical protein